MRMDGFELNKIAGAVLTAMLVIATGRTLLDINYQKHAPVKAGWALPKDAPAPKAKGEPAAAFDVKAVLAMLPKANADNGRDTFKKCLACHTPAKGGQNLVGPNLHGIVGRKVAQAAGFEARYSDAMKAHGGEWSWEELAKYLHSPATAIPGNKMVFAGVPDPIDLADLLAYLRTLADTPVPLPQ
jgi:cytochrome c